MDFNTKFRKETKLFVLAVIKFSKQIPNSEEAKIIKRQLLRSTTSVFANFRAFCRARSQRERYAKLCIVVEEADESVAWMELLNESQIRKVPENYLLKLNQ